MSAVVVVGDGRNHDRVAQQVGTADLLDAAHLLALDRAELGEVHLGPRDQAQLGTATAASGRFGGLRPPVCAAPLMTDWVNSWMSSAVMRPLRPEPLTSAKGTPSSRANLRTEGEAWGRPTAGRCGGVVGRRGNAGGSRAAAAAGAGAGAGAAAGAAAARAQQQARQQPAHAFQHSQQVTDVDRVAHLDLELFQHAGVARRNLHRGLVGLDRDQALLRP